MPTVLAASTPARFLPVFFAMPFAAMFLAATISGGRLIVLAALSRRASGQIGRFEFGDRLARRSGLRAKSENSFLGQNVPGGLIDTPAQNDIEWRRFDRASLVFKQSDILDVARVGIEKKQMLGIGQVRFDT
jgi:hypothetical protein